MQVSLHSLPQLNTRFTELFYSLEKNLLTKHNLIEEWFEKQWQLSIPPIYGSVDLRNAGYKIAPIDMNLFPAGFNNLNPNFLQLSIRAAKKIIQRSVPDCQRILLIPESHTRNLFYWENIKTLQTILEKAGFQVQLSVLANELPSARTIDLANGEQIIIHPLLRKEDKLLIEHFVPDLILLNNDLSDEIPEILKHLKQPVLPPAALGWNKRLKSEHFYYYDQVANEFAQLVSIDPWLITPLFRYCGELDFLQQDGLDCVIHHTQTLFDEMQKKYDQYAVPYQPFIIVKADAGTYGMAVMTVRHVDELKNLNRKQRTRMSATKGKRPVHRVIIQEGVYTFETLGMEKAVAEPVVYLWGDCVVGGFYRLHKRRGVDENLNSPGMQFEPIAFTQPCNEPNEKMALDASQNRLYVYGIVAKLSMLAAAHEMKQIIL